MLRQTNILCYLTTGLCSNNCYSLLEVNAELEDVRMFQLGLEEAFFLTSELECICICRQIPEGRVVLSKEEVWRCMQASKPEFGQLYIAYAHLRAKQWVVRSGIQYGADFMAYRHHPALVHSDYAVIVMVEGHEERMKTWTEMQAMNRLCGSVAKTLLLIHFIPKREGIDLSSPLCQGDFVVEAVEVRRWLPEKSREESDASVKPVLNFAIS
nr:tRNA-splicing endonuclease subunit Sen2-1-like isoform X2 [Physcomitrium patens]|eukprot:XP_024367926.1 tRNA-splicing endonuclease subunit Sen2-1-like isoform X2 [Physcomitrella patens]